jgi:membrane protein implicated in regulation of membrane protease activity
MRHPVLSTMAILVMAEAPFLAIMVLLGAPWWFTLGIAALATVLATFVSFRVYRNPEEPGTLVRFLQDPVGWFTDQ